MSIEQVSLYVFFISLSLLFYTYIGYGILATLLGGFRKKASYNQAEAYLSPVTIIVPAYNEAGILQEKIDNTFDALKNFKSYQVILITDGSTDGSNQISFSNPCLLHLHEEERKGKSAAINRSMLHATGEIMVITDANALVNDVAFEKLIARFKNPKTGAVSGEKKVAATDGSAGGEGFYWRYESYLKKHSARMYSLTGAAGELLAFRKSLFKPLPQDAILDDMELSLNIIKQGKVIDYEPEAFATELPSKSIADEFTRKVRISAGVFQTLVRNPFVFNPFKHTIFVFQFNSHRVLRWTKGLVCIVLLYISNALLIGGWGAGLSSMFFDTFFGLQNLFYLFVIGGFILRNNKKVPGFFFIPFYFMVMNIAIVVGFFRFLGKRETVLWKKAAR